MSVSLVQVILLFSDATMSSRRCCTNEINLWRNNHLNFLNNDPDDLEIRETVYARKGLYASRTFRKNEFVVNYRGELCARRSDDNIFVFDLGQKDNRAIDVSTLTDALGRYINDIDSL